MTVYLSAFRSGRGSEEDEEKEEEESVSSKDSFRNLDLRRLCKFALASARVEDVNRSDYLFGIIRLLQSECRRLLNPDCTGT